MLNNNKTFKTESNEKYQEKEVNTTPPNLLTDKEIERALEEIYGFCYYVTEAIENRNLEEQLALQELCESNVKKLKDFISHEDEFSPMTYGRIFKTLLEKYHMETREDIWIIRPYYIQISIINKNLKRLSKTLKDDGKITDKTYKELRDMFRLILTNALDPEFIRYFYAGVYRRSNNI